VRLGQLILSSLPSWLASSWSKRAASHGDAAASLRSITPSPFLSNVCQDGGDIFLPASAGTAVCASTAPAGRAASRERIAKVLRMFIVAPPVRTPLRL
jgi:hypothetical protein